MSGSGGGAEMSGSLILRYGGGGPVEAFWVPSFRAALQEAMLSSSTTLIVSQGYIACRSRERVAEAMTRMVLR